MKPQTIKHKGLVILATGAMVLMSTAAFADFTYTETTQVTGGSMMGLMKVAGAFSKQARDIGKPIVSTVTIKGNRMARINPDTTEIIDLDAETITSIDNVKHQYTVVTFEQLKQQIQAAMQKAKEQQAKNTKAEPAQEQPSNTEVTFDTHVRNTGQSKEIAGMNANESILAMKMNATDKTSGQTGAMAITNDMWLVAEIPGYEEVNEFNRKFAAKMGTVLSGAVNPAMLAQYQGAGQGLGDMAKEMSKIKGTPVLQVMRMGMTTNGEPLPAASEAPLPAADTQPATPSAGQVAQDSATSAIASKLGGFGGFGGFGHKKQASPPPDAAPADSAAPQPAYSVLMETKTELASFSSTADEASFAIPAGFKQMQMKDSN
jgi:hypothetical protein